MTNIQQNTLRVLLTIALSSYQIKHIASVAGWYEAIIIELGIIILSLLKVHKPLFGLLILSSGFMLSFHFDGGYAVSIQMVTEVLMSLFIPGTIYYVLQFKVETKIETAAKTLTVTQPKTKPTSSISRKVWNMKVAGKSIRKIAEGMNLSKGQVERMIKKMTT